MIINCISGPRNISTALMYSFAQHPEIKVVDEPFYAHYLKFTGIDHPGREEILESMSLNQKEILEQISDLEQKYPVVFLKNMAHHHEGLNWDYLTGTKTFFLIRDPKELILSFSKVIANTTIQDIGLKHEAEILEYLVKSHTEVPVVVDGNAMLRDPKEMLALLCEKLGISFSAKMLSWKKGPISEDGVWAKYWYKRVHDSTRFQPRAQNGDLLPAQLEELLQEAIPYYERLKRYELNLN